MFQVCQHIYLTHKLLSSSQVSECSARSRSSATRGRAATLFAPLQHPASQLELVAMRENNTSKEKNCSHLDFFIQSDVQCHMYLFIYYLL